MSDFMLLCHAHRLGQTAATLLLLGAALPSWAAPSPTKFVRDRAAKPLPKTAAKFSNNKLAGNADPTFDGHHLAFQRLVREGFFENRKRIAAQQKAVNRFNKNAKLPLSRPLSDEILALDFEATGSRAGSYNRKKKLFLAGWDEPTEIGAVLNRNRKPVERTSIKIKPDVEISDRVAELTGLSAQNLASAPRFEDEQVSGRLLKMMDGRPLVGHALPRNDWAWVASSFARRSIRFPRPDGKVLDTQLISYAVDWSGDAALPRLAELAKRYSVPVEGKLHGAMVDAEVTAKVFFAQMELAGAKTVGDAFRLMHEGEKIMRRAQRAIAEKQRQKAQAAAAAK